MSRAKNAFFILCRFLFPLENDAMTRRLVYLSARYGIAEMLLSGVTTFADLYYFEEEVAKACVEMGMRGVLGETVIGQPTCHEYKQSRDVKKCLCSC